MRFQVLLFATYREIVGSADVDWTADPGTTVDAFLDAFLRRHPRLVPYRKTMGVAVNQAFAEPSAILHEGDEVALLPPVSGGCP